MTKKSPFASHGMKKPHYVVLLGLNATAMQQISNLSPGAIGKLYLVSKEKDDGWLCQTNSFCKKSSSQTLLKSIHHSSVLN